ncbi:hypothetical protein E4U45_004317 [Claviceps purpurea]|nr:hypothetical protein E4U45_004317 [Claviceps purpurea]
MPRKKSQRKSTMKHPVEQAWYALEDVPNKGKGLIATRNIPRGTRILSEEALFTIPNVTDVKEAFRLICQQVAALSNEKRQGFLSMHNIYPFNDTEERLCSLPKEHSQERDRKIDQIVRLGELCFSKFKTSPSKVLGYADAQTRLYNELYEEDCGHPDSYLYAVEIAISQGDLARGRIFAQRVVRSFVTILGSDNPETMEYADMAKNPANYSKKLYGSSMRGKTSVDEIPQGLGPDDFENWLWRREPAPLAPARPMSPPCQSLFSGFADLPRRNDVGADSFQLPYSCFLGEIVETLVSYPLDLNIRDIDGKMVELHFYTKGKGTELEPSQYQRGHTVAILNASQYVFKFGPRGIRHTDPEMTKIFPISLAKMLALNNQVKTFSIRQQNGVRTCHGCGNNSAASSMKRCGMCLSFWYCNRECQTAGWNTKAHKADCKFLRDPDLRGLFLIKWDEVQDFVRFPLKVADESF